MEVAVKSNTKDGRNFWSGHFVGMNKKAEQYYSTKVRIKDLVIITWNNVRDL